MHENLKFVRVPGHSKTDSRSTTTHAYMDQSTCFFIITIRFFGLKIILKIFRVYPGKFRTYSEISDLNQTVMIASFFEGKILTKSYRLMSELLSIKPIIFFHRK